MFVELLKEHRKALAGLKKFVLSVGTLKKPRPDNAKHFFLRPVQDALFRCKQSTGENYTRDDATEWDS